jgi:hypothetical protein
MVAAVWIYLTRDALHAVCAIIQRKLQNDITIGARVLKAATI